MGRTANADQNPIKSSGVDIMLFLDFDCGGNLDQTVILLPKIFPHDTPQLTLYSIASPLPCTTISEVNIGCHAPLLFSFTLCLCNFADLK